jgi:hypothetical protein
MPGSFLCFSYDPSCVGCLIDAWVRRLCFMSMVRYDMIWNGMACGTDGMESDDDAMHSTYKSWGWAIRHVCVMNSSI